MAIESVAVYLGSSAGNDPIYQAKAREMGQVLAQAGKTLVYGGSNVGCMASLADGALAAGGKVIGVVPQKLVDNEIQHPNLDQLYVVHGMQERKAKMMALADAFIALPGGPGTMEEWFEVYTWAQVGYLDHPIALLNVNNYYQPLLTYLDHAGAEGFLHQQYRDMVIIDADPQTLLDKIIAYQPDYKKKW
jgi:uncharacterized protein (TIGR00730 family)